MGRPLGEYGLPCRRAFVGSLYFGTYSGVVAKEYLNMGLTIISQALRDLI